MPIPDNVIDKGLYVKAERMADKVFDEPTSAYRSMWIVKKYKEMGGRYSGKKEDSTGRWRLEQWVSVIPYITRGEEVECGSESEKTKVCRPLKRVSKLTPITIGELRKRHSDKKILELARKKTADMEGRLMWNSMKFIPSK